MTTELKFTTNINCGGCIATVTPILNKVAGVGNWEVDIKSREKTLVIRGENIDAEKVITDLKAIGYNARPV